MDLMNLGKPYIKFAACRLYDDDKSEENTTSGNQTQVCDVL